MKNKELARKIIDCWDNNDIKGATKLYNKCLDEIKPQMIEQMTKGFLVLLEKSKNN